VTWFAFHGYGTVDLAGVQEKQAVAMGFHGYATKTLAERHPNSVNLFQKPFVNLIEADYQDALATGSQPGGPNASNPLAAAAQGAGSPLHGIEAVGNFFNTLTQKNTWIRVGEVLAGLILLYVGLNALAQNTAVGNASQAATQHTKNFVEKAGILVPK